MMKNTCFTIHCLLVGNINDPNIIRYIKDMVGIFNETDLLSEYELETAYFSLKRDSILEDEELNFVFPLGIVVYEELVDFYKLSYLSHFYNVISVDSLYVIMKNCIIFTSYESLNSLLKHGVDLNGTYFREHSLGKLVDISMLLYALLLNCDPNFLCKLIDMGCEIRIDHNDTINGRQYLDIFYQVTFYLKHHVNVIEEEYIVKIYESVKMITQDIDMNKKQLYECFEDIMNTNFGSFLVIKKMKVEIQK